MASPAVWVEHDVEAVPPRRLDGQTDGVDATAGDAADDGTVRVALDPDDHGTGPGSDHDRVATTGRQFGDRYVQPDVSGRLGPLGRDPGVCAELADGGAVPDVHGETVTDHHQVVGLGRAGQTVGALDRWARNRQWLRASIRPATSWGSGAGT